MESNLVDLSLFCLGGILLLRWAERVWPPRNEGEPNREGVASGSATKNINFPLFLSYNSQTSQRQYH